ncbi:LON-domain-containing protein [Armillaria gallica]|uniref:LON-domain-containing protein n=1 Tax=Armillaria gallica TaxID=47427 RepID=A0A2H3DXI2_ARMGA|nr:LON-domain-containing protein [Armillaria gallica]
MSSTDAMIIVGETLSVEFVSNEEENKHIADSCCRIFADTPAYTGTLAFVGAHRQGTQIRSCKFQTSSVSLSRGNECSWGVFLDEKVAGGYRVQERNKVDARVWGMSKMPLSGPTDVPSDEDEKAIEDAEELSVDQVRLRSKDDKNPSEGSSSESSPPASSSSDGHASGDSSQPPSSSRPSSPAALVKQSVPAIYPQVLALPMTVEPVGEEDVQIVGLRGPLQTSFLHNPAISIVEVKNLVTQPYNKNNQEIAQLNPIFRDQITNFSINQFAFNAFDEPDKLAEFAAAVSTGEVVELQDVLDSLVVKDRLRKALLVLKKELINAQLQSKLSRDGDNMIAKRQREYYLMEQLKSIEKELGMESDEKDTLIEKSKERAASLKMPRPPE